MGRKRKYETEEERRAATAKMARAWKRKYYQTHRQACLERIKKYKREHPMDEEAMKVYNAKRKWRYRTDDAYRLRCYEYSRKYKVNKVLCNIILALKDKAALNQ